MYTLEEGNLRFYKHVLFSITFVHSRGVHEITWKNTVELEGPQMKI
jgi:hypothetical protein